MKLLKLFRNCAYDVKYETAGNDVNYAFVEEGNDISKTLYIYFQGSSSTTDWIRNFLFKKRPYKDMKIPYRVHRGFLKAWKEVEDIIINKIKEEDYIGPYSFYRYQKIIVVGYSHGGALAAFCHECVWFHRPDLRENGLYGYGFEAPKIYGWFKVKDSLRERWKNFVIIKTNNDIVTRCPPSVLGYCHVGKILQAEGDIKLTPQKWYIPNCIKSHYPQVVEDALKKLN